MAAPRSRLPAPERRLHWRTGRGLVARPDLFARLSSAAPGEIAVVCGPAGSGKTVLVRSWLQAECLDERVAWISVERRETDAQRFWLAVLAELDGAAGLVPGVEALPGFRGEAVVERLLRDLASVAQPVTLVIDDLHELRATEALRPLEWLLERIPATLRVVLATREEPRIGLHRLRLAGTLVELRAADLRFTLAETRELLEATGIALSDAGAALLHERGEGWAAGLRMAAISLAGHDDPEQFVREFSGSERTVARYLLTEVLDRQPPEVRDLLLRTSIFERVSGPLADALTGGSGAERILQELEDANAFVTAVDVGRSWFRYQHLFADLLSLELRRVNPRLIPVLHETAADWFEEHGHVVEAIQHAQAAHDWPHAARLLADNDIDLVLGGRQATLSALLAAFPREGVEADAELALTVATARLCDGLIDESAGYIAVAERLTATVPVERRTRFELRLTSARLWLASQRGDLDAAQDAMRALEARPADTQTLSDDNRASALMRLGIAELWSLHLEDARRDLERAVAIARRIRRPYLEIACLGHLALAAVLSGSAIPAGSRLSEQAMTIAEAHDWATHRVVAPAMAARAAALAWLGRIDEAEQWLDRIKRPPGREDEFDTEPVLRHARGLVRLGRGRFEHALAEFRAAAAAQPRLAADHALAADVQAWIVLTQGLIGATAARAALVNVDARARDGIGMRIAAATIGLADGRPHDSLDALAPTVDAGQEPMASGSADVLQPRWATVHALLLDAVARERLDDARMAEASLERALELAEPEGIVLPFMLVPVRELLERHPRHRTSHAALLTSILDVLSGSSPSAEVSSLDDPLSNAELRVLRYLPSNLRASEIAAELCLSANTVRTHLRHIYGKLDAHTRTDAVGRARRLGLLAPQARLR